MSKVLSRHRGRHGGPIHLERTEDVAWLAALVVGEGSFFIGKIRNKRTQSPYLVIAMQDKEAIGKAAWLMGVRPTKAGVSPSSGKRSWRVTAIGARMMQIFHTLKPFLTAEKIKQAERAIRDARRTGFITMAEMRKKQEQFILEALESHPGLSTLQVARRRRICYSYARRYLEALKERDLVRDATAGTPKRPKKLWFVKD